MKTITKAPAKRPAPAINSPEALKAREEESRAGMDLMGAQVAHAANMRLEQLSRTHPEVKPLLERSRADAARIADLEAQLAAVTAERDSLLAGKQSAASAAGSTGD